MFYIKSILTGVLKQVSNNASIEFYNLVLQGVRDYHKTVLVGAEINKRELAPKVLKNKYVKFSWMWII